MQHPNFTAERVAAFACPAGKAQQIFYDGKAPGLGLRVTANRAKSYVFEARLLNWGLRITIGDPRAWSVAAAQAEAIRLKQLTDQGIDPRAVRAAVQRGEKPSAEQLMQWGVLGASGVTLARGRVRAAVSRGLAAGHLRLVDLPPGERRGARKQYLVPAGVAP
jgi:hypothetical protein